MDMPTGHDKHADQIAYWNGPNGKRWTDRQAEQDVLLAPVTQTLMERASPSAGEPSRRCVRARNVSATWSRVRLWVYSSRLTESIGISTLQPLPSSARKAPTKLLVEAT